MRLDIGISPSTGYTSPQKLDYRRAVWADLARYVTPNSWAVMMPARGCEEIEAAIEAGVPIQNIFCFDGSAAVIATSLWRKKYPEIQFCTSKLSELPKKLARLGRRVSAINMDLCGTVAGESVDEIDAFLMSGILCKRSAFSVNLAKGREGKTLLKALERLGRNPWAKCERMGAFCTLSEFFGGPSNMSANYTVTGVNQGGYREHKTPMTWATFEVAPFSRPDAWGGFVKRLRHLRDTGDAAGFSALLSRAQNAYEANLDDALNLDNDHQKNCHGNAMARLVPLEREFANAVFRQQSNAQTSLQAGEGADG